MIELISKLFEKLNIDKYTIIIVLLVVAAMGIYFNFKQVTNHLPTTIKETKKELNHKIDKLDDKIDRNHQEVNNKIDRNHQEVKAEIKELNNKMDKIIFYLIDGDKEKLK